MNGTDFSALQATIQDADLYYSTSLVALNSSGVSGDVLFAIDNGDGDGDDGSITVLVTASGAAAGQAHAQHVHGLFDAQGDAANSSTPTITDDADRDGIVEVLEGVGQYGDVLLPLDDGDDMFPTADSEGYVVFSQTYDLDDDSEFFSPVTGTEYTGDDILPLDLREYVIHGMTVPAGIGDGTDGEVDGSGGYTPILPAAAGEITSIGQIQALAQLQQQQSNAGTATLLDGEANEFDAGDGRDTVQAGQGDDTIFGGNGGDVIAGNGDDDVLFGNEGNDTVNGGSGRDQVFGQEGDDELSGGFGADQMDGGNGDDLMVGGAGLDTMFGSDGADSVVGSGGNDVIQGGNGADFLLGGNQDDAVTGGAGNDLIGGGSGNDTLRGDGGADFLNGAAGDDLIVGGNGDDIMLGGDGNDIFGGLAGDDRITGGAGMDEFHFDAGTGSDSIRDFTQGEDVISFLDDGAIAFANSSEDDVRGDSDLNAADFDTVGAIAELTAGNDQQVVYSTGSNDDAMMGTTSADDVAAYLAVSDGTNTYVYYDADWSDTDDRELITQLDDFSSAMTVSDFDVY